MPGPTLSRRRLGAELKRCRESAGLTEEQVSKRFEWHTAKVTRIETGRVTVTARDVKDLLSLYGVTDRSFADALLALARTARQRAWWQEYREGLRPTSAMLKQPAEVARRRALFDEVAAQLLDPGATRKTIEAELRP